MRLNRLILVGGLFLVSLIGWHLNPAVSQPLEDKTKLEIQLQVEDEVEQSLGAMKWSITFVLAVLGITPVFVGISFIMLRGGIIRQLILSSQSQIDELVNSEIKRKFHAELERQKHELTEKAEELLLSTKERFSTFESDARSEHNGLIEEMTDSLKRLQALSASPNEPKLYEELTNSLKRLQALSTPLQNPKLYEEIKKFIHFEGTTLPSPLQGDNYSEFLTQGLISHIDGDYDKAITFFDHAIELDSGNPKALTAKGDSLYRVGDFKGSIAVYKKAIQKSPSNFEALTYLGNSYTRLKQYKEAVMAFKSAVKVNPNYQYAWYYLSRCYAIKGDFHPMLETLEKAISLNPICSNMVKDDAEFDQYNKLPEFKNLLKEA